ncbi:MAG: regulatory iron-sulfur-containing complex subunit RicT [Lachnospiraceae bacterium]|nr:regulatory iron-sulfur-containing complex subunit RicT [Lachnospiraceae bacterium]
MPKVTAVRLRLAGNNGYYDPEEYDIHIGDKVIVETERGEEVGEVTIPVIEVSDDRIKAPLKKIERICTKEDLDQYAENRRLENEAFAICKDKIKYHGLDMKLIRADYTFDRRKLTFYFSADGRVDFRALVKDLAQEFRTRIELRQIGVRDETRILGGLGVCGRPLCCRTYLTDFSPVSIKMAKEQNLSLNPTKISGLCGRLMCCLNNEEEAYEYLNKRMPRRGDFAVTATGEQGTVYNVNILRQKVSVLFEKNDVKEVKEFDVGDLTCTPKKFRKQEEARLAEEKAKRDAEDAAMKEAAPQEEKKEKPDKPERRENREFRKNNDHKNGSHGGGGNKGHRNGGYNKNRRNNDHRGNDHKNNRDNRDNSHDKPVRNGGYSSGYAHAGKENNGGD